MIYSGKKAVTTAGTAVVLGTELINGPLIVRANAANTGLIYIGNDGDGDVAAANGFELNAKDEVIFEHIGLMSEIWLDCAVSGEGVSWLRLNI